jgi:hypothetical protein
MGSSNGRIDGPRVVEVLSGGQTGSGTARTSASMIAYDVVPGVQIHVTQLIAALRANGRGDLHRSALLLLVEELSGRAAVVA